MVFYKLDSKASAEKYYYYDTENSDGPNFINVMIRWLIIDLESSMFVRAVKGEFFSEFTQSFVAFLIINAMLVSLFCFLSSW